MVLDSREVCSSKMGRVKLMLHLGVGIAKNRRRQLYRAGHRITTTELEAICIEEVSSSPSSGLTHVVSGKARWKRFFAAANAWPRMSAPHRSSFRGLVKHLEEVNSLPLKWV
ncbi:hypothetical protein Droror1_Dr00025284 [Drosera rotundifolia]